jgi:hypothetical protein
MNNTKLKNIIRESYYESLIEANKLATATTEILDKFPKLRKNLEILMTKDFEDFIDSIDYIAPRPTTFRVNLYNGQDFLLKWTGKSGFQAQISGKYYDLDSLPGYQQAIDKLGIIFRDSTIEDDEEEKEGGYADEFSDSPSVGGGGGNAELDFDGGPEGDQDLEGEGELDFDDEEEAPE